MPKANADILEALTYGVEIGKKRMAILSIQTADHDFKFSLSGTGMQRLAEAMLEAFPLARKLP